MIQSLKFKKCNFAKSNSAALQFIFSFSGSFFIFRSGRVVSVVVFKLSKNRNGESLACLNEKILNRQICHSEKWRLNKIGESEITILWIMILCVIMGSKTQYRFWQSLRSSQKQTFACVNRRLTLLTLLGTLRCEELLRNRANPWPFYQNHPTD